jgi:hypothetical protein
MNRSAHRIIPKAMVAMLAGLAGVATLTGVDQLVQPANASAAQPRSPSAPTAAVATTTGVLTTFATPERVIVGKKIGAKKVLTVVIAGIDGVPADATSVQLSVVGSGDRRASDLVVYPAGASRPSAVTEYISAHQSVASGALVALGGQGALSIYNKAGTAKVEIDVEGYVAAADSSQTQANTAAITTLGGGVSTTAGQVSALTGEVTTLTSDVNTLKTLLTGVTRTSFGGYPTLQFSGMNLQVVNGTGDETTLNGLGNLIIGYADPDTLFTAGTRNGSHNLITGDRGSWSSYGGLLGGDDDQINGPDAVAIGGEENVASGTGASVTGGQENTATTLYGSIAGGASNLVSGGGQDASIAGGVENTSNAADASIAGGAGNTSSGIYSAVAGGEDNTASDYDASVTGGYDNIASGSDSWVGGGSGNTSSGLCSSTPTVAINVFC